jgi:transcription antitermination factor NusG
MKYVYCIFYIERKFYHKINEELKAKGYNKIRAIVPEVRILKKAIKGKTYYEEVPVLFNYGFMRMPVELAYSRNFLVKLRRNISGIRTFLKSTQTMFPRKKKRRIDNAEDFDDFSIVATCPKSEVRRFRKIARANRKYSLEDIAKLKVGDYVTLNTYPYEGVDAIIKKINKRDRIVTLTLYPLMGTMEVTLPLDNVLYSVYHNFDPEALFVNPLEVDPNRVTSESVEESYNTRRL